MLSNPSSNAASASTQVVNTPMTNAGSVGGGAPGQTRDAKESSTEPKFGELLQQMNAKYGGKAEKPREIKKTLGKDDFLRIMITQMRHQDPTNPFKAEQMATEMAQFTSVEQLQNINQNLNKMASQSQPLERMAMTNLIGKAITVDNSRFPHSEGQNEALSFNLPKDATEVRVQVVSEAGEMVYDKQLGKQKAGEVAFSWDGQKTNSLPTKSGNYIMKIEAKDERGVTMPMDFQRSAKVVGVSFEGPEPILLIGDNRHQEKVTMRNIIRIENELPIGKEGGGKLLENKNPNFIAFQKGVGSGNLDANQISSDVASALAKYQDSKAAADRPASAAKAGNEKLVAGNLPSGPTRTSAAQNSGPLENGFPNGLHDNDESLKGGDRR